MHIQLVVCNGRSLWVVEGIFHSKQRPAACRCQIQHHGMCGSFALIGTAGRQAVLCNVHLVAVQRLAFSGYLECLPSALLHP